MSDDMYIYFSGKRLYGDDFSPEQVREWDEDEREAYAELGAKHREKYKYCYHELNKRHGYSHVGTRRFSRALGLGSAYGDEFIPLIKQLAHITILDPSDAFSDAAEINGVPCEYYKPGFDGTMRFESASFDLIMCLGVLHHIPNVSDVMKECHRCLDANGLMLVREPITSMGDWTRPRHGVTKRERGIPLGVFENIIRDCGFDIKHKSLCVFPPLARFAATLGVAAYSNYLLTFLDELLSRSFSWNIKYHRTNLLAKLAPAAAYFVLGK